MKIEIYCDESCSEVLFDKKAHNFFILGSLWMPAEFREEFKADIKEIRKEHNYFLEIKWNKVSPKFLEFYKSLINYFFSSENLRFRALAVESEKIDLVKFHEGDAELSYYKFYYQLLRNWILDFNEYNIFLDYKVNKERTRLKKLKEALDNSSLTSIISNIQSIHSKESTGIQFVDLLIGAVNAKFNNKVKIEGSKSEIIKSIEQKIGKEISATSRSEYKFNIFRIQLQGGW